MAEQALIIDDNRVVSMHYQLSNGFGEQIDSSQGDLPMVYMHNTNVLLSSLERELTGFAAGDHVSVTIYPEDGYGYVNDDLIVEWPRESFNNSTELSESLQVGMRIKALGSDGDDQLVSVKEIRDDVVVLDANHPLAGQVLNFVIAIVDVREPTAQELEQGFADVKAPPAA